MPTIKTYNFTNEDLTSTGNQMKQVFIETMIKEGVITKEKGDELLQYCIVVVDKKFFGAWWDKIFFKDKKEGAGGHISVVKVLKQDDGD